METIGVGTVVLAGDTQVTVGTILIMGIITKTIILIILVEEALPIQII